MNIGKKAEIYWIKDDEGDAKQNPMKLKRKAIGPAGQVVEISMATGKTIKSYMGNSYAQLIAHEKERRGWVWYEECAECGPVEAMEFREMPGADDHLCEKCQVRETLIRTRVQAKGVENADYMKLFETQLDKLTKVLESKAVDGQLPKVSDEALLAAMSAPEPKKRKGKGPKIG